ncbi:hypothetical protein [Cecembia lonarensis]|uniref:HPr kinase/phosphorylase n=1 Tax=Cecembia lonarensis (strain CCUG 58316 / KCTC 22772 / LW9) TaxID=1225176 RepID=K1LAI2_CECL9|nr:hypothetical protein [Cecembia lonarensis]EKB47408.1 hypothetical protein B879_03994 [Cecembia lonarensis LW9]
MAFFYQVFGLVCDSALEIPAFFPINGENRVVDFTLRLGKVQKAFSQPGVWSDANSCMNAQEFFMEVPNIARYFVKNGQEVLVEPLCEDMRDVLLYFKSNCLAALLFQKGKIPFHVSGVVDKDGGVWLFSADSGIGKSTTALKLKEKGYPLFTDDTALIEVAHGQCWAKASYPLIKAWPQTMAHQSMYSNQESFPLFSGNDKQGIHFHQEFIHQALPVKGIVFLKIEGDRVQVRPLKAVEGMSLLLSNVYRGHWVTALNQNPLQFKTVAAIAQTTRFCEAVRPNQQESYETFANAIIEKIFIHEGNGCKAVSYA